jgi:hypothetical protein
MAKTPVDLYRRGNANSPRMDNVRLNKDIAIYERDGKIWVKETVAEGFEPGGISTFSRKREKLVENRCWHGYSTRFRIN